MASYKPVTAALRVLDVLAAVNMANGRATVGETHRLTGIDKATIVRMLETLQHAGYVMRDEANAVYQVTGKTLLLSNSYDRHSVVAALIADELTAFRREIGWPSDVAILDNDAMLVIKSSREGAPITFSRPPGYRAPMLATSLGLAYVAFCPQGERAEIFKRVAADPKATNELIRSPEKLAAKIESVRRLGYATMDESYSRLMYEGKIYSIGVPIMFDERVFATMNVIYLLSALTPAQAEARLLTPLQAVADKMGRILASKNQALA
ncbi:MAG: helix-turn-helix domain-containing protein [Bosea sp.]|uniref:IclR family transcriptional regulator domain-containing protein n=1 Tax=Bosea sp. (in: a-proteobacteria) TaxID=1871050 RepID=UPI001ACFBF5E|nr:IclR family transcriptional regulator C-terminal domain-containing protein [Bosea sp. (in: a-proteobacteria)]MBN9469355.1 helix-turn-helix domain-containing protein [Bosea sp. (in: a-proteobacteria)]